MVKISLAQCQPKETVSTISSSCESVRYWVPLDEAVKLGNVRIVHPFNCSPICSEF